MKNTHAPPRLALFLLVWFLLPTSAWAYDVSFYAMGHQDDWQLFMGSNAYNDVLDTSSKTVFIYLTAGDAARGSSYAMAREDASRESTRFVADAATPTSSTPTQGTRVFNGHTISYWQYKNTVSYYFRLPDGLNDSNCTSCLEKLYMGQNYPLVAIDGSASYYSWPSLIYTLQALITYEGAGATSIWLNSAETNQTLNPGDHHDHDYTSRAVQSTMAGSSNCAKALWIDYDTANRTANLSTSDTVNKAALLAAYSQKMNELGYFNDNSWNNGHRAWLDKAYYRVILSCGTVVP